MIQFLCKLLPYKEIGWKEIGEVFYRFTLAKTPWFNLYLHSLSSPNAHAECHDHPWSFVSLVLWPGYDEYHDGGDIFRFWQRKWPGMLLFRPATWKHNVVTPYGTSWSLVLTGPRIREWGFKNCHD